MRVKSLSLRLFLLATLWSSIGLLIAGFTLVALYRASLERAFDERLELHLKSLVGAVSEGVQLSGTVAAPQGLTEPRFDLPLSGWYWTVKDSSGGRIVAASRSLVGEHLPVPSEAGGATADGLLRGAATGPDGKSLRVVERRISFDGNVAYFVAVAGDAGDLDQDLRAFIRDTVLVLGGVGLLIVLTTYFQVRIGLKPLRRLQRNLQAIRQGDAERLAGVYPTEIAPVASELNALIDANRDVIERAHTHVGNLAHGLKTPLSVITNEAGAAPAPHGERIAEQAGAMRAMIQAYLDRARMAAQHRVIGVVTEVEPVIARLARVMTRLNADKGVEIGVAVPGGLKFRGEQHDLEEMAGNLLENATKWSRGAVSITAEPVPGAAGTADRRFMRLVVDDDGPGLPAAKRAEAMKRGKRLDETVPGSGLGLSIVTELAQLYGGRLELDDAPGGGLRAVLILPML